MLAPHRRSTGVALLTVMLIMAMLTTLVVYLVEDEYLAIRRVSNQQEFEQRFQIAVYAEQWARDLLERDALANNRDYLGEAWSTEAPSLGDSDRAVLETGIEDLQSRFNLNNLAAGRDEVWYPAFQRLLAVLGLAPGLADAVVDWVDEDLEVSGSQGAEDAVYELQDPAYRAANHLMSGIGELAWIHGMTPAAVAALAPYVVALPASNVRINVNTAGSTLLRILVPDILDLGSAEALIAGRGEHGYRDVDEILASGELAGQWDRAAPLVSVRSQYFKVHSRVELGRYATVLYSVVERSPETHRASVIRRRRGMS